MPMGERREAAHLCMINSRQAANYVSGPWSTLSHVMSGYRMSGSAIVVRIFGYAGQGALPARIYPSAMSAVAAEGLNQPTFCGRRQPWFPLSQGNMVPVMTTV